MRRKIIRKKKRISFKKYMILNKIVKQKNKEIKKAKNVLPLYAMQKKLKKQKNRRLIYGFKNALKLKNGGVGLIAEIKKASPSTGIINKDFNLEKIINTYKKAKVDAVSVLTDEKFFQGSLENLKIARKKIKVPILRKDFIIDPYQIFESRFYGADAILLIANILDNKTINNFIKISRSLNMDCLVEIHDQKELGRILKTNAEIIGINNRDLKTFKTDIKTSLSLAPKIPSSKIIVSESGIKNKKDAQKLKQAGVNAILVGTTIMKSKNILKTINNLTKNI